MQHYCRHGKVQHARKIVPDNTILHPIAFASKSLTGAEHRYIEREVLGVLHGLKKFYHYCFTREVHKITNHKPLVSVLKKDMAMLSQCIQCILLKFINIGSKFCTNFGPEVFIAEWLSCQNYKEDKDEPIRDVDIRLDAIQSMTDIPECVSILQIQQTTAQGEHLQCLKNIIITGWPNMKDQLHIDIRPYWSYKDDLAVIDGIVMKGRCIVIPDDIKKQVLDQLHVNHMGIKKPNYMHANLCFGSILIST